MFLLGDLDLHLILRLSPLEQRFDEKQKKNERIDGQKDKPPVVGAPPILSLWRLVYALKGLIHDPDASSDQTEITQYKDKETYQHDNHLTTIQRIWHGEIGRRTLN